ncbi:MAG: threonine/serine dehydratase [Halodesulfurarchaeum sp.]
MADTGFDAVESPDETTIFEYHDLEPPTTRDVYETRQIVSQNLPRTPLVRSESLSETLDADVFLKREDTLPTGSFKIRGMYALLDDLDSVFHEKGVLTASMGNHGQAMAYAARDFGIPATVVVPETLENPGKIRAMEQMGAAVRTIGEDFDEAREHAESLAREHPYRYVHGGNEAPLVAGRASAGLEVMDDRPDVDVLINPVGGGSSASAYSLTVGRLLGARVVGVQSASADAVYRAWSGGDIEVLETANTIAEGLATRTPFALPLTIIKEHMDDFVLVEDDAIGRAVYRLLDQESIVAEGAGAAGVAAALERGEELAGKTVVLPITGRNIATEKLRAIIDEYGNQ